MTILPPEHSSEVRHFRRHQHLAREGEALDFVYRIEDGWACRYRLLGSGRRQITALFLPDEYCEPQWLLDARPTGPVAALTSLRVRRVPLARFSSSAPGGREHARTMLSATLGALNRQSEWIAALGRKSALERVSWLLWDVYERLQTGGHVVHDRCAMPLTQADLADIVGLTPVHVNRVLKQLRLGGLIELTGKRLRLPAPAMLRDIGSGAVPKARLGSLPAEPASGPLAAAL